MNNNLSPDKNHYNKEEEEKNLKEENLEQSNNGNNNNSSEFREKIIKMFKIVIIALIVILVIGFVISLFTKKDYNYATVEDIMKEAAIDYFKDNKNKLPKNTDETVEIAASVLANNKYMKSLDWYLKNDECSGKVLVEKSDSDYSYTPYLTCNGDYTTTKFYEKIKDSSNVVTDGFGVYYMNDEYVYRGTDVDNYVRFSDSEKLWRVIKVTSNNEVVLISNNRTQNKFVWDTRYNNTLGNNSGINTYKNSNISSMLDMLYNNTIVSESSSQYKDELEVLTKEERKKVVEFDACVGTRSVNDTVTNGTSECSITEKTKISLLNTYDYMNASLDTNCTTINKRDCQNYNYLTKGYSYWLINGKSENNSKVYQVSKYASAVTASNEAYLRVVIHIDDNVMLEKGEGTKTNPYVIR